ncbi:hypothetical protein [Candidatus Spongiihabitans sp.]|uniref:hypothetical protein n=1 Tax=Candidatus Spongiihabitans sp. TaxID=3101308 RepID=UPI003C7A2EBC
MPYGQGATAMDGGSANNVGNNYLPTAKDGGSVDTVWNEYRPCHPWQYCLEQKSADLSARG